MFKVVWKLMAVALLMCMLSASVAADLLSANEEPELFSEVVSEIYKDDFSNFQRVLDFARFSRNLNFKAVILKTLYVAMKASHHTESPIYTIPLYNEIESLLNKESNLTRQEELMRIRNDLIENSIVPVSADILRCAFYGNTYNRENSIVQTLLDLLNESNGTISDLAISRVVNDLKNIIPADMLLNVLPNFSKHLRQNVYAMVALQDRYKFQGPLKFHYYTQLRELTLYPEYKNVVPAELRRQVLAIIPAEVTALLTGDVCIYRRLPRDPRLYFVQRCSDKDQRACVSKNNDTDRIRFKLEAVNPNALRLKNVNSGSYLNVRHYFDEGENGTTLNFFAESIRDVDRDLYIHFENSSVVLSNQNRTMYICASSLPADQKDSYLIYTKNPRYYEKSKKECKWFLKNC